MNVSETKCSQAFYDIISEMPEQQLLIAAESYFHLMWLTAFACNESYGSLLGTNFLVMFILQLYTLLSIGQS